MLFYKGMYVHVHVQYFPSIHAVHEIVTEHSIVFVVRFLFTAACYNMFLK